MRLLAWSQSHSLLRRTTVFSQCFPIVRGVPNPGLSYWPNSRSDLVSRNAPGIRCLSLSSVSGDCTSPLDDRTLPEYFEQRLLPSFADRPALICRAETRNRFGGPVQQHHAQYLRWTFAEFDNHVEALARGLSRMGIGKGDQVAVIMGNTSAYAALQWACARIGAILVTINPAYRAHELVSALNHVGVSTLIVVPSIRTSVYLDMLLSQTPGLAATQPGVDLDAPEIPTLRRIIVDDDTNASSLRGHSIRATQVFRDAFVWERSLQEEKMLLDNEDVVNLLFTSGTTGAPKAVSLTHRSILNNAISIGRCMDIGPRDIVFNIPPLFHCFGLCGNLAAWVHGAGVLYPSATFSPSRIVDALTQPNAPDETCSALYGVPTHFLEILQEIEHRALTASHLGGRLRTGIASGSPVPMELMRALRDRMGIDGLSVAYGMTETSPVSFQTTTSDPLDKRVETVGRVQPHVNAKIIGCDGQTLQVGTPGEICVSGYLLQKGYWNDEEQTRQAMKTDEEGILWMHTGDQGVMDHEGYLRIVGRIKDIIVRGGENLYPVQIENLLMTHPDVVETAVVAVPDSRYGEVVGAWIVLRSGVRMSREEVRTMVKEGMNPQNAPSWVWFVGENGMDQLPKTASGKVQKHILRSISETLVKDGQGKVVSGGSGR